MDFELRKKQILHKDKSVKKSIDKSILNLCMYINQLPNYYTTSSCSGRICLSQTSDSKTGDSWLYVTHYQTSLTELRPHIKVEKNTQLWFRYESFILHIACKTLADGIKLMKVARRCGLKKTSLLQLKEPYLVEITHTPPIHTLLGKNGKLLVLEEYIDELIQIANMKLDKTHQKITELEDEIKKKS